MMIWNSLVKISIAGNGFALLAFGIGQLLIKGKRSVNYWSFAFFTYSAAVFIYTAAVRSMPSSLPTLLIWLDFPVLSLTGPLFFFYFSRLADPDYRFAWREQWLFAPTVLSLALTPLVCALPSAVCAYLAEHASNVSILWVIFCCVFFLARLSRESRKKRRDEAHRLGFIKVITSGVVVFGSLLFISAWVSMDTIPLVYGSTLFILAVYFYHFRHPELFSAELTAAAPARRQGKSKLSDIDIEKTIDRLNRTMEHDKPYLDEDLSLPALADKVGLSPHQLSELLNQKMGIPFKSYINRYRVQEARRILHDKPDTSIIDIALDCGFRSKSAFNTLFKEETGITPSEYRRAAAKKEGTAPDAAP
jgi:AraC-like DNA-binding protein